MTSNKPNAKSEYHVPLPPSGSEQMGVPRSPLYVGSRLTGSQFYKGEMRDVEVTLQDVDLPNSTLCGSLTLRHPYSTFTTFFEGEIVGRKHPFLTRKWGVSRKVDRRLWAMFKDFDRYVEYFDDDLVDLDDLLRDADVVFMRWKERFLVSRRNVQVMFQDSVFTGFYYVCLRKSSGIFEGYFYHHSTPNFCPLLLLTHVVERSTQTFQFR